MKIIKLNKIDFLEGGGNLKESAVLLYFRDCMHGQSLT
ncbi:hypothetical protein THER_0196 [Thermodesulfovibrio sp. N1]|nr:hypothetical protein THER_0196 [Thermodesulfovibrio sp. N1]